MRAIRGDMPDTASNCYRKWVWLPTPSFGGDGVLSISQRPLKGGAPELDVYGVEEVQPEQLSCRTFVVVNLTDPEQEQPYKATVGAVQRCSCDAGVKGIRRTSCKHRDAITAAITAGAIPARQLQGA